MQSGSPFRTHNPALLIALFEVLVLLLLLATMMAFALLYSFVQLSLVVHYLRRKRRPLPPLAPVPACTLPVVTVQLPIYNERYVVDRLITCICNMDYPVDRLEIQLLDDSTDETVDLIADKVRHYRSKGWDIHHIRRATREGFKAGALQQGLAQCRGTFLAIFDADFLPNRDFLRQLLPYFHHRKVGAVQSRWTYLNEDYSFITKLQAFGLHAHFSVEQAGRYTAGHFINFNGTAGVWRTSCVQDAGGWEADTLTEDLDLSYRAQLKGWRVVYAEHVQSPSELPVEINALKAQQFRWTKGGAECVRKNLHRVLRSDDFSLSTKIHAAAHLANSSIFVVVFLWSLLSLPLLVIQRYAPQWDAFFQWGGIVVVPWVILVVFYYVGNSGGRHGKWPSPFRFAWRCFFFLSVSMGLSLQNALAVLEGYAGKKSPFVRTPKFAIREGADKWKPNKYSTRKIGFLTYLEGVMLCYFLLALIKAIEWKATGMVPFLIFLIVGYGFVFFSTVLHQKRKTSG